MGKENKTKTPPKAPQPKEKRKTTVIEAKNLENLPKVAAEGLDPNRTADTLTNVRRYFLDNPQAAEQYGITPETVQKVNRIAALGSAALMLHEIVRGKSEWAATMKRAELAAVLETAPMLGFTFDQKLLPNLSGDAEEEVQVPAAAITVSKETKAAIEEEAAAAEATVATSPADVKSEEDLKASLLHFLTQHKRGER